MTPHDREKAIRALTMKRDPSDRERAELEHLQADKRRAMVPNTQGLLRRLRARTAFQLRMIKAAMGVRG